MKTLYLECNAGASGDMILGALTDLLEDPQEFKTRIDRAGIPNLVVTIEKDRTSGISGSRVHISIGGVEEGHDEHHAHHEHHYHEHHSLSDVTSVIDRLDIPDTVKRNAVGIYGTIAKAESEVHGEPVDLIHFHEVGALDAVADIVGACILMDMLSPEKVIASPIRTGYGHVECAHGILPVPAPATASILKGMPVYAGDEEGEFCTPTGAAILKHFVTEFGRMPTMAFDRVGCGLGYKQFRTANILRAFVGDTEEAMPKIKEIKCNIDDMTSEDMGRMIDYLLSKGALDAFIAPCIMKKGRPGFELTCLCRTKDIDNMVSLILAHTSTIGMRVHECDRYAMTSRFEECRTEYGSVRIKVSEGFGQTKWKPEYKDLLKAAEDNGVPISRVRDSIAYKKE